MKLVLDLPPREKQVSFNRQRWEEICRDPELAKIPGRIESNALGQILMSPPPAGDHSHRTLRIQFKLHSLLGGLALPECPISTIDGVRAADVGWYSEERFATVKGQIAFEMAPEICVEVLSPDNSAREMKAKRALYFEAGALECWQCGKDNEMAFYYHDSPHEPQASSRLATAFPATI